MRKAVGKVDVCVTVDVEDSDVESLVRIKEICQNYNAPITWFVDTKQCSQPEALNLLSTFVEQGDEVGLHIHWGNSAISGLRHVPIEEVKVELEEAMGFLKPRFQPKSFRGGGLCQTTPVLEILEQKGFEFDSSVAYKLDMLHEYYQGHENIRPVSAYYPSRRGYDVIAFDDSERLNILEIPVSRAVPSLRHWGNMLYPGETPLPIAKFIFAEYYVRRCFQPLVLMVVILHSWNWRRYPSTLGDLDKFLSYVSKHEAEFDTIRTAGCEWRRIWQDRPEARKTISSYEFDFNLKTRLVLKSIRLAIFIHNLRYSYRCQALPAISRFYRNTLGRSKIIARLVDRVRGVN